MGLPNNIHRLIEGEGLSHVTRPFRAYNPRENLLQRLGRNDPYSLATGTYHLKLIDQYKARFREMKLDLEVREFLIKYHMINIESIPFSSSKSIVTRKLLITIAME